MRHSFWTVAISILSLAVAAQQASSQVSQAGDIDRAGRVLAKIKIAFAERDGVVRTVTGWKILIVGPKGENVLTETDAAGNARAWLEPGSYRISTLEPLSWSGVQYQWNIVVDIQPGIGLIRLSEANASTPAATEAAGQTLSRQDDRPRVRVFVDCQTKGCDLDYFRTEIPIIDYMRDRADALVHMLITSEVSGGGGSVYTVNFIGLKELSGMADTLHYSAPQSATADQTRSALAEIIKLGLVRYLVRAASGDRMVVSYPPAVAVASQNSAARDPWNLWVFSTSASGSTGGEESQNFLSLRGSSSANRTSEAWKFRLGVYGDYDRSKFTFSDGSEYTNYSHSYGASQLLVRSIGAHWAIGERASLLSSTYLNQKLALRFAPTIEFNVFPYSQSTRRRLTLSYAAGVNSYAYEDTTIFNKLNEIRPDQSASALLDFKQPWGSVSFSLQGTALLDDFSKHRATLFNGLDVRLFKGFSLNTYLEVTLLRDQLYLAKGELTDQEILLRQRQLASTYSYSGGIGITYTFGSIFNNIVNPRFDQIR